MPKCVLKQFTIKKGPLANQFHCFDFTTNDFRKLTPDGVNTCEGYYQEELEKELSKKIETPLGNLIKFVKSEEFQKEQFSKSN